MTGAMAGIKVVELAHWVAMPAAMAIMADWGAEVVKIENPQGGDPVRGFMGMGIYPFDLSLSPPFEMDNRNKRSVVLDMRRPEAQEAVHRLVAEADVFATNLEPDTLSRFGVEYEALAAKHPRLIYASLSGYGDDGEEWERPGFDYSAHWARSGIMGVLGEPDGPPVSPRPGFGDHSTSLAIVSAVSAALFNRERTGKGQRVSTALLHTAMWQLGIDIQACLLAGQDVPRTTRTAVGNPLLNYYRAGDGRWLFLVMPQSAPYWSGFCKAIGRKDLEKDPSFGTTGGRWRNGAALVAILEEVFARRPRAEWGRLLDEHGCIWGLVQTPGDIDTDPQVWANGFLTTADHPAQGEIKLIASPVRFSTTPASVRSTAPQLGEHTEEVLLEHGYTWEDLTRFKDAGAIL